ncbi:MAG: ABC transporter substrate-binding protein, partial [Pikeienuella sp.]
ALRDAGFKVDLQAMDWQTLVGRRASQEPPANGGWNMFFTNFVSVDLLNPIVNNMVNGMGREGGWFGWPEVPRAEELRNAYALSTSLDEQKKIAEELQILAYDEVMYVPLGQFVSPSVWSSKLEGVNAAPAPLFWNVSKSE